MVRRPRTPHTRMRSRLGSHVDLAVGVAGCAVRGIACRECRRAPPAAEDAAEGQVRDAPAMASGATNDSRHAYLGDDPASGNSCSAGVQERGSRPTTLPHSPARAELMARVAEWCGGTTGRSRCSVRRAEGWGRAQTVRRRDLCGESPVQLPQQPLLRWNTCAFTIALLCVQPR